MKKFFYIVVFFLSVVTLQYSTFILQENEQAIVIQLGRSVRSVKSSGPHLKIPFVQEVVKFDKRVLQLDSSPAEAPTLDKKYIVIDTTARWKIADPLKFFKTLRAVPNAVIKMEGILDGITKDTVSSVNLIELVRNSNRIFKDIKDSRDDLSVDDYEKIELEESLDQLDKIKIGREKISENIAQRAGKELASFGINLIDVQIRSIAYKKEVEEKVYKRMISERKKITTKIRSSGVGQKQEILGQLTLSLKKIESEAYKRAQEVRGQAEATAMRIFNQELKEDPSYFEYVKTLESYKKALAKGKFILSTNSKFLHLLNGKS